MRNNAQSVEDTALSGMLELKSSSATTITVIMLLGLIKRRTKMTKGDPIHPREYTQKYILWIREKQIMNELLTCRCGVCTICEIYRPLLLQQVEQNNRNEGDLL